MGTSSNFGNMFSAAGASLFLSFLPMLPSQILLNNLLYDTSQLAIPTHTVGPDQVARPARWDVGFIRRFMLFFGPISSLSDFVTFGLMLWVFHAGPALFRSGWFVESLATQTLAIFAIRIRRIPFFRSRPSTPMLAAALGVAAVGAVLPATPLAPLLGFQSLPGRFFLALTLMVLAYLALIELGKHLFYHAPTSPPVRHRAARFTTWAHQPPRLPRRAGRRDRYPAAARPDDERITWSFVRYVPGYQRRTRPRVRRLVAEHAGQASLASPPSRREANRFRDHTRRRTSVKDRPAPIPGCRRRSPR